MHVVRESTSEEYTGALARGLADLLRPGDVVALSGELGAGKTTFVRALAAGLGVDPGLVSSPTFVMVNQYPVAGALGQLVHVDAYRLRSVEDLEALGWDRLFDPSTKMARGAAVIEWAERIEGALPRDVVRVRIEAVGERARRITLELPESWRGRERLEQFVEREPIACRVTGRWVWPTSSTYPFVDERSREVDMYQWFTGGYRTSRGIRAEEGESGGGGEGEQG